MRTVILQGGPDHGQRVPIHNHRINTVNTTGHDQGVATYTLAGELFVFAGWLR